MVQKCLGCNEECELDGPATMTGCVYEDGVYPKDADIWSSSITGEDSKLAKKAEIQKKYPDEWKQEEH